MDFPKLVQKGLSGSEMLPLLERGHLVRRSCWLPGFYIRICNERGFDSVTGRAVFNERKDHIYTLCTNGSFLHLGFSSQPFNPPGAYESQQGNFEHSHREGEGIGMLFADDWEDCGFMGQDDFDVLTKEKEEYVRGIRQAAVEAAIKNAEEASDD